MASRCCLHCDKTISPRQQALQCTSCDKWQHRTCGSTGISQDAYREASRLDRSLDWKCASCASDAVTELIEELHLDKTHKKRTAKFPSARIASKGPAGSLPASSVTLDPTVRQLAKRVAKMPSRISQIPHIACASILDDLDDLHLPPVSLPDEVLEDELPAPRICPDQEDLTPDPDYQILEATTQRGKPKLIDNLGFTYTLAREGKKVTAWRCAVRNSQTTCSATVQQRGDTFTRGPQPHNHSGEPGAAANARIQREVKLQAAAEIFEPALNIVERVMTTEVQENGLRPALPKLHNLTRMANYTREKLRPEEPHDLDFSYDHDFIPDFLVGDVRVNDKRHLLFATEQQLDILKKAKTWYLDGTFKVVKEPFTQLWSIHAFVSSGQEMKQLPFLFVLMSSRRTIDYTAVFRELNSIFQTPATVQDMVLDFELSLWKAIQEVYPGVRMRGCAFHWTQSVYRKIQGVGLQTHYMQDVPVHRLCKQLLGLPFIPAEHIRPVFEKLQERAVTEKLQELTDYIQLTWIESSVWSPEAWSVFGQSVRTNNDVEGWHHRLNAKAKKGSLTFYMLLRLLHEETAIININLHLISEHRLKRHQRTKYRQLQADIFEAWDKYAGGTLTVTQLLDTCGQLYTPTE